MTTHTKTRGIIHTKDGMQTTNLLVRFTHDYSGNESLSISDDKEVMLQVDFKDVDKIIKKARKQK